MNKHPSPLRLALWALVVGFNLVAPAARAVEYVAYFGPVTVDARPPAIAPAIVAQPQNTTNVAGTTATFTVTATGTAPLSYQWQRAGTNLVNGGTISGALSNQLTISSVQLSDAGGYWVVVTNAYGSTNSAAATLTVTCPAITLTPSTLPAATVGSGYSQALSASGGAGSYTFALTSGSLPAGLGLTNGVISGKPTGAGTNTITETATDTNGCGGSQAYTVGVAAAAPEGIFNVRVSQRAGTNLVDLHYDLATTTTDPLTVAVAVSTNGGLTYDLPATHFTGDVGLGVTAGTNKWIVWDAAGDWPGGFSTNVFFRLTVSDVPYDAPPGMALIPAGPFVMGDTFGEGNGDELPLHTNQISAFYMDKWEITKALWDSVYSWAVTHGYSFEYGAQGKATNHPAQSMTWYDAVKWCNARSEQQGRTPAYYTDAGQTLVYRTGQTNVQNDWVNWSSGYRLPTEAEWEKAARGGASGQRFPWSGTNNITHSMANYSSSASYAYDTSPTRGYHPTFATNATPYTSPVGYFAANGYGLYDMAGNEWECCWDWYGPYSIGSQTDPRGPASGSGRVGRGGGWYNDAIRCRAAGRGNGYPTLRYDGLGFRSVLPPGQ